MAKNINNNNKIVVRITGKERKREGEKRRK